ncbi:hypothetical protein [Treponema endosymbiont of Eucomonympha sp.]|uniref:hypothetical protein n=1 Tax=Treponema endosymbiont of Eucomonympha sp. TaxID=1580831 RepID=UPI00164F661A|nr:hypothetical protein [Treponema endosymbiont of Eucomonympha sp.]
MSALKPIVRVSACCGYQEGFAAASTSGAAERAYRGGESRYVKRVCKANSAASRRLAADSVAARKGNAERLDISAANAIQ